MSPPTGDCHPELLRVLLVDDHPLRRAGLARYLAGGTETEGFTFRIFEAATLTDRPEAEMDIRLALLNIGGDPATAPGVQGALDEHARSMAGIPLCVLSDREEASDVVVALRAGARGFVTTRMDPGLVVRALRFIMDGGVFFPPNALLEAQQPAVETVVAELRAGGIATDADFGTWAGGEALTARQVEVLRLLRQGESNKRIARELGMCESTVKVHVRQIMRKLGVSNRTQAALYAFDAPFPDFEARTMGAAPLTAGDDAAGRASGPALLPAG